MPLSVAYFSAYDCLSSMNYQENSEPQATLVGDIALFIETLKVKAETTRGENLVKH